MLLAIENMRRKQKWTKRQKDVVKKYGFKYLKAKHGTKNKVRFELKTELEKMSPERSFSDGSISHKLQEYGFAPKRNRKHKLATKPQENWGENESFQAFFLYKQKYQNISPQNRPTQKDVAYEIKIKLQQKGFIRSESAIIAHVFGNKKKQKKSTK